MKVKNDHRSKFSNLSKSEKIRASTGCNPWPPRYRCNAFPTEPWSHTLKAKSIYWVHTGAIIGDGDRKRAPFLVLGLAPWYGTIFLFLEQIAPSPAAHARTCCEDICRCRAGKVASEIPEIFYTFSPLFITFMSVGILLQYFHRKLLQFERSKPGVRQWRI